MEPMLVSGAGLERPEVDTKVPESSLLTAELGVLLTFMRRHCEETRGAVSTLCTHVLERSRSLQRDVVTLAQNPNSETITLERSTGWDLFGSGHELDGKFDGA